MKKTEKAEGFWAGDDTGPVSMTSMETVEDNDDVVELFDAQGNLMAFSWKQPIGFDLQGRNKG